MANKLNKIHINKKNCIGCSLCVSIAPKTFAMGRGGKGEVLDKVWDSEKKIKEAIPSCPVAAISK